MTGSSSAETESVKTAGGEATVGTTVQQTRKLSEKQTEYQARLENKLIELSRSALNTADLEKSIRFFSDLYKPDRDFGAAGGFRHSYASASRVLYGGEFETSTESMQRAAANAQHITNNLEQIAHAMKEQGCEERVLFCFGKLQDHMTLESQRLNLTSATFQELDKSKDKAAKSYEDFDKKLGKKLANVKRKIEKVQNQHIAILGVFAAVALVFNGGISFLTGTISVANPTSIRSIAFITVIVGFVLVNMVALLFLFLWKAVAVKHERGTYATVVIVLVADFVLVAGAVLIATGSLFPPAM